MRPPNLLAGILFLAAASVSRTEADPILVTLADGGSGGIGPLSFAFDMDRQGLSPFDFPDVAEFEGDFADKQGEYRINVADYFHVEMDGWTGYGYNWLLERSPRDIGIFEEFCQVLFFKAPGQTLILQGAWTSHWSEDTPLSGFLETEQGITHGDLRIASLQQAIPEPVPLALFATGLLALGFAAGRRPRPTLRRP